MPKRCRNHSGANASSRVEIGVYPQGLVAGDRIVSRASMRLCRANKPGALAGLCGFRAGFYGAAYVWPLGTLDPQVWAAGFLEGRGQRGRAP